MVKLEQGVHTANNMPIEIIRANNWYNRIREK